MCPRADDALSAFSVTIDDNCDPDHGWWIQMGDEGGFSRGLAKPASGTRVSGPASHEELIV